MSQAILFSFILFFGCLSSTAFSQATSQPSHSANEKSLAQALQLAKAHRYAEAAAVIRRVSPPEDRVQRIVFFRLRASIESGLGHSAAAANDMEAATRLAPENLELKIAASLARLEAQLESQQRPRSDPCHIAEF